MTLAVLGVADLGLTGVSSQTRAWRYPVAVGDNIYWFPYSSGSGWDIIKFNVVSETVTRIPTGLTDGFGGAVRAADGNIYATPAQSGVTATNRTVLRLTPGSDTIATTTHSGTLRAYGHPVVVGTSVYAFNGGTTNPANQSQNVLKVNTSTFAASIINSGVPSWVSGGAVLHTNSGRIFLAMDSSNVSGTYAAAYNPATDTKNGLISSPAYGFTPEGLGQPIYHAGTRRVYVARGGSGGAVNRFLYYDPTISSPFLRSVPWTAGSSDANTGNSRGVMFATGLPSLVEMPDGTIAYIAAEASVGDFLCTIDPASNTATRTPHLVRRATMGGILAGNGKAYWFDGQSNQDPQEWDGTSITTIGQANPTNGGGNFDIGDRPVRVRGNLYNIHSSNDPSFSSWITKIETAASYAVGGIYVDGAVHL